MSNWDMLSQGEKERVLSAVNRLLEKNPELPDLLSKLADLKENKPFVWTMAVKKLCSE